MPTKDESFDRKLAAIFKAEAGEHLQNILATLVRLEGSLASPEARPLADLLFREFHSLKGAARAVGEDALESVCHAVESVLAAMQRGHLGWSRPLFDLLHEVARELELALSRGDGSSVAALGLLLPKLENLLGSGQDRANATGHVPAAAQARTAPPPVAQEVAAAQPTVAPSSAGETVRISVERLGGLLYQVEELVSAKLGAHEHALEADRALKEFAALSARLRAPAATAAGRTAAAPDGQLLAAHEARLRSLKNTAARDHRNLAGAVDTLLADVKKALMLPISSATHMLSATVRELARSQQKEVDFRLDGGDVEIDRRLLEELREPLLHLLRNSVDHGIESPALRQAAGKPARGSIALSITQRAGGEVLIVLADDGAGIDTAKLANAGRRLGVAIPEQEADADLLPLVFMHGLSTADRLTAVSGRGLGLAIVQEKVERLGGTITLQSDAGRGTTFSMALPPSLATFRAIAVRAGGQSFLLPTSQVARCARFSPTSVGASGARRTVCIDDETLVLTSLAHVLGLPAAPGVQPGGKLSCVVLESPGRRVAFAVDAVLGEQEVLSKPVDAKLTTTPAVAGAAALGNGDTVAILNVAELIRCAVKDGQSAGPPIGTTVPRRVHSILVVEDSITSRTLLKNILEMAGYSVTVALDGADGLERLRASSFDLVLSDIEMPRMDGFELTKAIRGDKSLTHLPVVLVTSLSSPADRERGAEAGANAYIVKSSFDQGHLLKAIGGLV